MPGILRSMLTAGILVCSHLIGYCQESPEGRRRGFNDLSSVQVDLNGDGKEFTFIPRTWAKKVSYPWKFDKKLTVAEEHFITFDLNFPTGQRFNSVFSYKYGFTLVNQQESSSVDYWVYALIPPSHPKAGVTELFFYSGDDTSDEMIKLRFKNGKFHIISRKQPFSEDRIPPRLRTRLTLRSTRTPPALPFALSPRSASSAPFSASVQAGPVSFIR